MNVAYINPFIAATRTVFDTMVHVPFMLSKPRLASPDATHYNVAATIQLAGPAAGHIHLCMGDGVAIALAKGFAGTDFDSVNADCLDALGEIINMIAGDARKNLPVRDVTVSVPYVKQQAILKHESTTIIIPCDTGTGRFCIEVALTKTPAVEAPAQPAAESAAPAAAAATPAAAPAATAPAPAAAPAPATPAPAAAPAPAAPAPAAASVTTTPVPAPASAPAAAAKPLAAAAK